MYNTIDTLRPGDTVALHSIYMTTQDFREWFKRTHVVSHATFVRRASYEDVIQYTERDLEGLPQEVLASKVWHYLKNIATVAIVRLSDGRETLIDVSKTPIKRVESGVLPTSEKLDGPTHATWIGDNDILPQGTVVDVLATDDLSVRRGLDVPAGSVAWVRWTRGEGEYPLYRSCDQSDLDFNTTFKGA